MGAYYRAKASCRIGGAFRKAGDVFYVPRFDECPHFLEEVPPGEVKILPEASTESKSTPPGPMPEDLPGAVRDNETAPLPGAETQTPAGPPAETGPAPDQTAGQEGSAPDQTAGAATPGKRGSGKTKQPSAP